MDISIIKAANANDQNGFKLGNDNAPVKILEFQNVRCPYCKRWFEETDELLSQYVAEGKLQRVIKLFDKEKVSLQRGNVMHHHINYATPDASHDALVSIYETQHRWGDQELDKVAEFAEKELGLKAQDNKVVAEQIVEEAAACNIQFVPTVIVGDKIFDESITVDELKIILDEALAGK